MYIMKQQAVYIMYLLGICHIVLDFPMPSVPYTDFQAYLVRDGCPPDKNAWENASDILNCSNPIDSLKNRYHCMPNRQKTQLLEFCYPRDRVRMSPGFCFVLADNGIITKYDDTDCTNFVNRSCQMSYDVANEMYKYPGCLKINPIKGCYTSDPDCPSVPDVVDSTSASETTTIEVPGSSQLTNYSIQELPAEEENGDTTIMIVIAVIVPLVVIYIGILVVGIIYKRKKCCFKKGYSSEETPLLGIQGNMTGNVENLDSEHTSIKLCVQTPKTSSTNGPHSVEWKKDGAILQMDSSKYSGGDLREPSLIIQNVSLEDAGNYQCEITLDDETVYSEAFLIETAKICLVKESPILPFICKKYKNIKLKARFERKNEYIPLERLTVQWQKFQKEGENDIPSVIHIDNAKYTHQYSQIDQNGKTCELVIHQATEMDSGAYYCVLLDGANGKLDSEKLQVFVVGDFYDKDQWKEDDRFYEEPEKDFCLRIRNSLDQSDVVTLVGPPGCGKTFTARHIALEMKRNGWDICQIFNMEELLIEDKLQSTVQILIIFDHPFGKTTVNVLNLVYFLMHRNIYHQLLGKTKMIMTCRSEIFEEIAAFPIDILKNVIYLTKTYLGKSPGVLKEIVEEVNVQSGQPENDYDSENKYLQRLCSQIGTYFSESQNHMYDFYALILLARHGNIISKKSLKCAHENVSQVLENNISKENFTEGIKSSYKSSRYFGCKSIGETTIYFCKLDFIIDAFLCNILQNNPKIFLKCAENDMLCSQICPFSACKAGKCWKVLDREQYPKLCKNLLDYLISDDLCAMFNVINAPYWDKNGFMDVFLNVLSENSLMDVLFGDRKYLLYIAKQHKLKCDKETNKHCDALWDETTILQLELLFEKLKGIPETCANSFTTLSTNFTYWVISYGDSDTIDRMLKLAVEANCHKDVDTNRCITLACYRNVDIVLKVMQHLNKQSLKDVRFSKKETLFFNDDAIILPLHVAVARGKKELVDSLVENEVFVNSVDHKQRSSLLLAVEKENTEITKMLLEMEDIDVNLCDCEKRNPLHLATIKGNEGFVKMLLKKDAKLNQVDNECKSPLMKALEYEHKGVITILLRKIKKMEVDQRDAHGKTALFFAMKKGTYYNKVMNRLVQLGADINLSDEKEQTALHVAAKNDCFSMVKYLVQNGGGALVNKADKHQDTPVHYAIQNDNYAMVAVLVEYNADVNFCNKENKSPLYIAVESKVKHRIVKLLLEKGALIPKADEPGAGEKPILHLAYEQKMEAFDTLFNQVAAHFKVEGKKEKLELWNAFGKNDSKTIESILKSKVNVRDVKELKQYYLLHEEKMETFESLVKNRADINQSDVNQRTVLSYAVESNDENTVLLLLRKNAFVEVPDIEGMAPLHYAAQSSDRYEILKLLVKAQASINVPDKKGRTPLHIAAEHEESDYLDVVEHLCRHGAVLTKEDCNKKTALTYAVEQQNKEVIKYLVKQGAD